MQIAKFFAALGFKVDTTELTNFESKIKDVRKSTALLVRNLRVLNDNLTSTGTKLKAVNNGIGNLSNAGANTNLKNSFNQLHRSISAVITPLNKVGSAFDKIEPKLIKITRLVRDGITAWGIYSSEVRIASHHVSTFGAQLAQLRASAAAPIVVRIQQRTTGAGGGAGHPPTGAGGAGSVAAAAAAGGIAKFLKPMSPTGMMAGGALGGGYILKEIVQSGREIQKMENILLSVSRGADDFANNLTYVKEESKRLGLETAEFGTQYAKTFASAKKAMPTTDIQKFSTSIAEYSSTLQMTKDEQKGIGKAIAQMFSKNKIQAEEARGQLADRMPAALQMLEEAARNAGIEFKSFDDAMKQGLLDPKKVIPEYGILLGKAARENGALDIALKQSIISQQAFVESMKIASHEIMKAGLDEILDNIFKGLSYLVDILKPLAIELVKFLKVVVRVTKSIIDITKESKIFTGVLIALAGAFLLSKVNAMIAFSAIGKITTLLLKAINRFPLLIALGILFAVFKEYDKYLQGEENWVTVFSNLIQLAISHVDLLLAKINLLFTRIKHGKWSDILLGSSDPTTDDGSTTTKKRSRLTPMSLLPTPTSILNTMKAAFDIGSGFTTWGLETISMHANRANQTQQRHEIIIKNDSGQVVATGHMDQNGNLKMAGAAQ